MILYFREIAKSTSNRETRGALRSIEKSHENASLYCEAEKFAKTESRNSTSNRETRGAFLGIEKSL